MDDFDLQSSMFVARTQGKGTGLALCMLMRIHPTMWE
jgi:hypothetical protein